MFIEKSAVLVFSFWTIQWLGQQCQKLYWPGFFNGNWFWNLVAIISRVSRVSRSFDFQFNKNYPNRKPKFFNTRMSVHISRDYLLSWLPFGGYMMFHVHFGRISRPLKSWPQCIGQKYTVNICTAFVIHTWIHPLSSDLILNPQNTISIVLQYRVSHSEVYKVNQLWEVEGSIILLNYGA